MTNILEKIKKLRANKKLYSEQAFDLFDKLYELCEESQISEGEKLVSGTGMSLCGTTVSTTIIKFQDFSLERVPATWLTGGYILKY